MQYAQLGNTDMNISRIGFGAWAIGGGEWLYGWGDQDDDESIRTIYAAIDSGVNWIDTAVTYGGGHSEEVVGKAIRGMRNKPFIFTKCGIVWDDKNNVSQNLTAESLRLQVEGSLKRLGTEIIDLYQIHWPNTDEQNLEGWQTLNDLKREGKIRYAGVSNFSMEQMRKISEIAPVSSNQIPYSIITADAGKEIMPYCAQKGIGVLNYSPMGSGLLTGKMNRERFNTLPENDVRRDSDNFKEPKFSKNLALVEILSAIAVRYNTTVAQIAIAWTLHNPASTASIVGLRKVDQVADVAGASDITLKQEDMELINGYCAENLW